MNTEEQLNWFQRNKEHLKEYKRKYYQSHPEYRERKRKLALERYYRLKELSEKTDAPPPK